MATERGPLGFYAFDVGPASMLADRDARGNLRDSLAKTAEVRGHEAVMFPPQSRGIAEARAAEMRDCMAVLLGLSSNETGQELGLAERLDEWHVPVFVVADTSGAALRPQAKTFAPKAAAAFVALPSDVVPAQRFGYRRVEQILPFRWGLLYEEVVRGKRKKPADRKGNIYISGFKENPRTLADMVEAARGVDGVERLHLRPHPAEEKHAEGRGEEFHRDFIEQRERRERFLDLPNFGEGLSDAECVGMADVSVLCQGSTGGIAGAFARAAMVNVQDPTLKDRIGKNEWFVDQLGGAVLAQRTARDIRKKIEGLLTEEGRSALLEKQEENFPLPLTWDTAPLLIRRVEEIVAEIRKGGRR